MERNQPSGQFLLPGGRGGAHDDPLDGPDVDRGFKLGKSAGLPREGVRSLVAGQSAVGRDQMHEDWLPSVGERSQQVPEYVRRHWGALGVLWIVLQQGQRRRRISADDDRVGGGLVLSARQFLS